MTDPTATRYRQRPSECDAIQWTGTNADALRAFAGGNFDTIDPEDRIEDPDQDAQLLVEASHWVGIKPGDWVLKFDGYFVAKDDVPFRAVWGPAAASVVLPEPTSRAAVLLEAADHLAAMDPVEAALAGQHAWVDAATELRRLAAEAQQQKPTTADKAAALGLTDTEYRARSHEAAVAAVRAAIPGMYAHVGFRLEDVLNEAARAQQQPETEAPVVDRATILREAADVLVAVAGQQPEARAVVIHWGDAADLLRTMAQEECDEAEAQAHLDQLADELPQETAAPQPAAADSEETRCPAKHGALGRICELPAGHRGMHTGSGPNGGAVWDGDAAP